jgi:hypothetical protein
MERRWWLLGVLLVIAIAAGFGVGSALKSTSAPAESGSLASNDSGTGTQPTVARPGASVPVPPLKAKASKTSTTTSTSSSTTSGAAVTTATVTQTATTPPPSIPTTASHTTLQSTTSGGGGGGGIGGG